MKRILSLTLSLAMLALVFTSVGMARPAIKVGEPVQIAAPDPGSVVPMQQAGAREDTLWLFAESGPGSFGSPGTSDDGRGWSFDWFNPGTQEVEGAPGGWFGVDNTAQPEFFWHVADVAICAGTDTDMSAAVPFGGGDNTYAAWCGAEDQCGWENPTGYGNNWNQWMRVDLDASSALDITYAYSGYVEGTQWDYFQLFIEVDGALEEYWLDNTEGPTGFYVNNVTATGNLGDVVFSFFSDGAWSDQDNLFPTNVGACWVDNIEILADATLVLQEDFESGSADPSITFTAPAGAGDYAELYSALRSEDQCTVNTTFAWAFFDLLTLNPEYGNHPVIAYGPPYVDNSVQSPLLNVDQNGNVMNTDFFITADSNVIFDWWVYRDNPMDPLIFFSFDVAAQIAGVPCLQSFANDNYVYYGDFKIWDNWIVNVTEYLADSSGGGAIEGIAVRLSVVDMCPYWCDSEGSGESHPPPPFFDNMKVGIVAGSALSWSFDSPDRFQDNFPDPVDGFVRMDHAGDFDWSDEEVPVSIVDSLVVTFNADLDGGVAMEVPPMGTTEERPKVYMYYRIVSGPNAGDITGNSGDPETGDDQTDLEGHCYSPWIGAVEVVAGSGEFWNKAVADFAHYGGNSIPIENTWAFDLNDEFFLPGDELEYFFEGYSVGGNSDFIPDYAESDDPALQNFYTVRCLPTGNSTLLYVQDDVGLLGYWREAFDYNGITDYDFFYTQAPSSGQSNGLASRASLDDLSVYDCMIWDSGNIGSEAICDEDDKTRDDQLITDWLTLATQSTYAWFLGDNMANDLDQGDPFLTGVLGASLVESNIYYDDRTGVVVPLVYGTHPLLQYLGGDPYFWVYGGCPVTSDFALVAPTGALTETFQEWEVDPGDNAKAGLLNNDPDGNGQPYNDQGTDVFTKVVFNPYSYYHVRDAGYATSAGVTYHRVFVGHVLENVFDKAVDPPIDVDETPAFTKLDGNFPNPFNPKTTIRFALANAGDVNLTVYDITGRAVKVLVDGNMEAKSHEVVWDGTNNNGDKTASGVYFYKLHADGKVFTEKMVLLK